MIAKKKEDYLFSEGTGRPYGIHPQKEEPKDDAERQKPVIIHLGDLQQEGKGPVNFHTKRGRTLGTLTKLQEEQRDVEEAFDIE